MSNIIAAIFVDLGLKTSHECHHNDKNILP